MRGKRRKVRRPSVISIGAVVLIVAGIWLMISRGAPSFAAPASAPGWSELTTIHYDPAQDDEANGFLEQAATELQSNLEEASPESFSVATSTPPATGIFLRVDPTHPDLTDRNEEAFKLVTDASGVHITGKSPIAVRHGAYTFLEELGYRWFFKHPIWKVAPDTLGPVPELSEVQEPAFIYRRIWSSFQDMPRQDAWHDWHEWNRLYGPKTYPVHHSYSNIVSFSGYKEHPDWFCYSDPPDNTDPDQLNFRRLDMKAG